MTAQIVSERQDLLRIFSERARDWCWFINKYAAHRRINGNEWYGQSRWGEMDFESVANPENCDFYQPARFTMTDFGSGPTEAIELLPRLTNGGTFAKVYFYQIRPKSGAKMKRVDGPEETLDSEIIFVESRRAVNRTDKDAERDVTFSRHREKTDTSEAELAAKLSVGLEQSVGYGGDLYGVQGETKVSVSAEVSAGTKSGSSVSDTDGSADTVPFFVPANSIGTLTRTVKRGRYKKDVTFTGELDWSVCLWSDSDFSVNLDSRDTTRQVLFGVAPAWGNGDANDWPTQFNRFPVDTVIQTNRHGTWVGGTGLIEELVAPIVVSRTISQEFRGALDIEDVKGEPVPL